MSTPSSLAQDREPLGVLPGPYRIETPCGKRLLGFMTPTHADRWLTSHVDDPVMRGQVYDVVQIAELWCIPDPYAGTPEQMAADALHPLFQELHAVYTRIKELEALIRAQAAQQESRP